MKYQPCNLCLGSGCSKDLMDTDFTSFFKACIRCDGTGYSLINVRIRPLKGSRYWRTYLGRIDFSKELAHFRLFGITYASTSVTKQS